MNTKCLKVACILIYSVLLVMVCLLVVRLTNVDKPETEIKPVVQPVPSTNIQIIGDYNSIIIRSNKDNTLSPDYVVEQILKTRQMNGDETFTKHDATIISKKIKQYAEKHGFSWNEGLIIVNVESDFCPRAYNDYGKAYGLCQITQGCLDEYNWKNNTNYKLTEMFDVDKNLEVGMWYYRHILTHYADHYGYIMDNTPENALKDAYICYNIGVTMFNKVDVSGRNALRSGYYPCDMYGSKKGDVYEPVKRYSRLSTNWS